VVSAGPGWGKSTAVAQWVASRGDTPVAWLNLTEIDDHLNVFWHHLLRAMQATGAIPADHPLRRASTAAGVPAEVLVALHQGLAALPGPMVLVLDDFHVIEDAGVLEAVQRLVDLDSPLRLILLTRVDPLLALHRLRVDGHLVELTSRDLAFGPDEVQRMARAASLSLTRQEVDQVLTRTQGWPAGVRLATLYLSRPGSDNQISQFTGTEQSVSEYLLAEVLDRNDPATRQFLLRTAVADRLSAGLAEAIVPGTRAQALLEQLERSNQFVTALGADRAWFSYHPLLRDLLVYTLRRDDPDAFQAAHRAAAMWLASHEPLGALNHAAAAGEWTLFATIFTAAAGPALVGAARPILAQQLRRVPYGQLPASVPIQLCAAGLGLVSGQIDAMDEHVAQARALLDHDESKPDAAAMILLELLTGARARHRGDASGAVASGAAAMRALAAADPFPSADSYRAIAAHNRGVGLLWTGHTTEARTSLSQVEVLDPASDIEITRVTARGHLAMCHLIEGRLDEAQRLAEAVVESATDRGWASMFYIRPAHWTLATARLLRGDPRGADMAATMGLAADMGGVEPAPLLALTITQGLTAISLGRPRAAEQAAERVRTQLSDWSAPNYLADEVVRLATEIALVSGDSDRLTGPIPGSAALTDPSATGHASRARLMLAAGDLADAREAAKQAAAAPDNATIADFVAQVEAWIVLAQVADRRRLRADAVGALGHAIDLARPRMSIRPFQVAEPGITPLLTELATGGARPDAFITALMTRLAHGKPTAPEPTPLIEPLTARELAVLAELPTMKSNSEIATESYVSINTVKAHLKSAYRKLDVRNRRDAVRRARDLGLIP
jgi:LuxR family maltose regulon positive regulatory protein